MSNRHDPSTDLPPSDLVGRELFWRRRDLGRLEELIDGNGRPYFLVDTRHWTYGTQRLVPASLVRPLHRPDPAASISIDPETIRWAPDFDVFKVGLADYWEALDRYYADALPTGTPAAQGRREPTG